MWFRREKTPDGSGAITPVLSLSNALGVEGNTSTEEEDAKLKAPGEREPPHGASASSRENIVPDDSTITNTRRKPH